MKTLAYLIETRMRNVKVSIHLLKKIADCLITISMQLMDPIVGVIKKLAP